MIIDGNWVTREVRVNGKRLSPRKSQKIFNHSPDGFNWGYGGSGPAQLALALLLLVTDQNIAVRLHQDFKWEFVAKFPQSDFKTEVELAGWVAGAVKQKGLEIEGVNNAR